MGFKQGGHVGKDLLQVVRETGWLVPAVKRRESALLFEFSEEPRGGVDRQALPGGRFGERVAPADAVDDSPERKVVDCGRHVCPA